MTTANKPINKRLALIAIISAVCVLSVVLGLMVGCAPTPSGEKESGKTEERDSKPAMENQPVSWTMESDCSTCHTSEAATMTDSKCPQASAHSDLTCITCHTEEPVLKTAHEGITYGDKPATKATVVTVNEQSCIECHGTMEEMEAKTAGSTALTDSNGKSVNPHERIPGEKHEANYPSCTSCHNNHSNNLEKDAMKYCAQCHHRGVFTCGNCHSVE